jgi:HAMP domain-containing protein
MVSTSGAETRETSQSNTLYLQGVFAMKNRSEQELKELHKLIRNVAELELRHDINNTRRDYEMKVLKELVKK